MFSLKHVVLFFILKNTVSSFCVNDYCWSDSSESYSSESYSSVSYSSEFITDLDSDVSTDYSESEYYDNYSEDNSKENSGDDLNINCLDEEYSLISRSDIKYLIEEKVDISQIKEILVSRHYSVAAEIFEKYKGELEEFLNKINNHPEHMREILGDVALLRQKLEPKVEEVESLLEEIYTFEDDIKDAVNESADLLITLEKYKNICKTNCEDISIENRPGHKIDNPFIFLKSVDKYCVRVKDLHDDINKKVSEAQAQLDEGLKQQIDIRDNMYATRIIDLKFNIKEAAVKQFGKAMYDFMSLQDEYHHFVENLESVNLSSEKYDILHNIAEIKFRRIGLHRDLEKYRKYCMKCPLNQRVKRDVFDMFDGTLEGAKDSSVILIEEVIHTATDYVDEIIKAKINEIRESINSNFTSMFEELDEQLNDPDFVDAYIIQLLPIEIEIRNDIKEEYQALRTLSSRIPAASIDNLHALLKELTETVQNLKSARQFIYQFISRNSI